MVREKRSKMTLKIQETKMASNKPDSSHTFFTLQGRLSNRIRPPKKLYSNNINHLDVSWSILAAKTKYHRLGSL